MFKLLESKSKVLIAFFAIFILAVVFSFGLNAEATEGDEVECTSLQAGDAIKVHGHPDIWKVNEDGTRSYFPGADVFKSWNSNDSYKGNYKYVTSACMNALKTSATGATLPRSGSFLLKQKTGNTLYAVESDGTIVEINKESAKELYGSNYKALEINFIDWLFYQKKINTEKKITDSKPHSGMIVKQGGKNYLVEEGDELREITSNGLKENQLKTSFIRTINAEKFKAFSFGNSITKQEDVLLRGLYNPEANFCIDGDGGKNAYKLGRIRGDFHSGDEGASIVIAHNYTDFCVDDNTVAENFCSENHYITGVNVDCKAGDKCVSGACVRSGQPAPVVSPIVTPTITPTTTPSTTMAYTCSKTDTVQDYYTMGQMMVSRTDGNWTKGYQDYCRDDGKLAEFICALGQVDPATGFYLPGIDIYTCPNGCYGGACIVSSTPSVTSTVYGCTESDGDRNFYEKGNIMVTGPNNWSKGFQDYCRDDNEVADYSCNLGYTNQITGSYVSGFDIFSCTNGCSNGACISTANPPVTTTPVMCQDITDNGLNYNVFGEAYGPKEGSGIVSSYEDTCGISVGDSGKLFGEYIAETHCSTRGNYVHTQWYACPNGCVNGKCAIAYTDTVNCSSLVLGDNVKMHNIANLFKVGEDGHIHEYPTAAVWKSWYPDGVYKTHYKYITQACYRTFIIGKDVEMKEVNTDYVKVGLNFASPNGQQAIGQDKMVVGYDFRVDEDLVTAEYRTIKLKKLSFALTGDFIGNQIGDGSALLKIYDGYYSNSELISTGVIYNLDNNSSDTGVIELDYEITNFKALYLMLDTSDSDFNVGDGSKSLRIDLTGFDWEDSETGDDYTSTVINGTPFYSPVLTF